jgi:hypothetical protein
MVWVENATENQSVKNFGFSLRISAVQFLIELGHFFRSLLEPNQKVWSLNLCETSLRHRIVSFSLANSGAFFKHIQQQTKNTDKNGFHSSAHHTASHNFRNLSGFSWHLKMRQTAQQFRPKPSVPKGVQTSSQRVGAFQQFRTRSIRLTSSENERSLLPNGFVAKEHFV